MKINSIEITGFGSYVETSKLELKDVAVAAVVGDNGAGKSTLFTAVLWCLYGYAEGRTAESLHNRDHKDNDIDVKVNFTDYLGVDHLVGRKRVAATGKTFATHTSKGETSKGVSAVTKLMTECLSTDAAVLCQTAFSLQDSAGLFSSSKPGERSEVLARGLKIGVFKEWLKEVSDAESNSKIQRGITQSKVDKDKLASSEIGEIQSMLKEAEAEAEKAEEEYNTISSLPSFDSEKLAEAENAIENVEKYKASIKSFKADKKSLSKKLKSKKEALAGAEEAIEDLELDLDSKEEEAKTISDQSIKIIAAAEDAQEHLDLLDKIDGEESKCYVCNLEISEDKRESLVASAEEALKAAEEIKSSVEEANAAFTAVKKESDDLLSEKQTMEKEISRIEQNIIENKADIENSELSLTYEEEKASEYEQLAKAREESPSTDDVALKRDEYVESKENVVLLKERLQQAETSLKELEESQSKLEEIDKELNGRSLLKKALSKDGMQKIAMERKIAIITSKANHLLRKLGKMAIRIGQDGTDKLTVEGLLPEENTWRAYSTFSGGEKMRLDIALRVALTKCLGVQVRSILIDEGWGALDQEGTRDLAQMLHSLVEMGEFDQVYTISHSEGAIGQFNSEIHVEKTIYGSKATLIDTT